MGKEIDGVEIVLEELVGMPLTALLQSVKALSVLQLDDEDTLRKFGQYLKQYNGDVDPTLMVKSFIKEQLAESLGDYYLNYITPEFTLSRPKILVARFVAQQNYVFDNAVVNRVLELNGITRDFVNNIAEDNLRKI